MAKTRTKRKGSNEGVIASRILQDIISNSSDSFRRYLESVGMGVDGGRGQVAPAPAPITLAGGGPPVAGGPQPHQFPDFFPMHGVPQQEPRFGGLPQISDIAPPPLHGPGLPPQQFENQSVINMPIPPMPFPDVRLPNTLATPMPGPGSPVGPPVRYEDGSVGRDRIPYPGQRPGGEQQINNLLRVLGLA